MIAQFYVRDNNILVYIIDVSFEVVCILAVLKLCLVPIEGYFTRSTWLWYVILLSRYFLQHDDGINVFNLEHRLVECVVF